VSWVLGVTPKSPAGHGDLALIISCNIVVILDSDRVGGCGKNPSEKYPDGGA
jgi:hypothetical protein